MSQNKKQIEPIPLWKRALFLGVFFLVLPFSTMVLLNRLYLIRNNGFNFLPFLLLAVFVYGVGSLWLFVFMGKQLSQQSRALIRGQNTSGIDVEKIGLMFPLFLGALFCGVFGWFFALLFSGVPSWGTGLVSTGFGAACGFWAWFGITRRLYPVDAMLDV